MVDIIKIIEDKVNKKFKEGEDYTLEIISPKKKIYTLISEELKNAFTKKNLDLIFSNIFEKSTFSSVNFSGKNITIQIGETKDERKKREAEKVIEDQKWAEHEKEWTKREAKEEEEKEWKRHQKLQNKQCDCCEKKCDKEIIFYFKNNSGKWIFACSFECYEKLYSGKLKPSQQAIVEKGKSTNLGKQANNSQPNKFTDYLPWIIGLSVVGTLIFVGFLRWLVGRKRRK